MKLSWFWSLSRSSCLAIKTGGASSNGWSSGCWRSGDGWDSLSGFDPYIYIGSLVTAYGSYQAVEQNSVKLRFLARAWLGFVGFLLALSSAGLAVMGKWVSNSCMGNASVWVLLGAFGWAVFATIQGIREIR